MHRFFINSNQLNEGKIIIKGDDINHIKNVLRYKIKDKIEIVDLDNKNVYVCEIILISDESVICSILSKKKETHESNVYIHVLQGIPKFEKMEFIIEKCTELGVCEFTPLIMKRCVVKLDNKTEQKKLLRWNKIVEVAAKQSKRDFIPLINSCTNLKNIYENVKDYDIVLIAYEKETSYSLKQALNNLQINCKGKYRIAIIIGPEGGIAPEEIEQLLNYNFRTVSLGNRILRTETAPIAMVSNIIYELEGENNHGAKEK